MRRKQWARLSPEINRACCGYGAVTGPSSRLVQELCQTCHSLHAASRANAFGPGPAISASDYNAGFGTRESAGSRCTRPAVVQIHLDLTAPRVSVPLQDRIGTVVEGCTTWLGYWCSHR